MSKDGATPEGARTGGNADVELPGIPAPQAPDPPGGTDPPGCVLDGDTDGYVAAGKSCPGQTGKRRTFPR